MEQLQYQRLPLRLYLKCCESYGWEPSLRGLLLFTQQKHSGVRTGDWSLATGKPRFAIETKIPDDKKTSVTQP